MAAVGVDEVVGNVARTTVELSLRVGRAEGSAAGGGEISAGNKIGPEVTSLPATDSRSTHSTASSSLSRVAKGNGASGVAGVGSITLFGAGGTTSEGLVSEGGTVVVVVGEICGPTAAGARNCVVREVSDAGEVAAGAVVVAMVGASGSVLSGAVAAAGMVGLANDGIKRTRTVGARNCVLRVLGLVLRSGRGFMREGLGGVEREENGGGKKTHRAENRGEPF